MRYSIYTSLAAALLMLLSGSAIAANNMSQPQGNGDATMITDKQGPHDSHRRDNGVGGRHDNVRGNVGPTDDSHRRDNGVGGRHDNVRG